VIIISSQEFHHIEEFADQVSVLHEGKLLISSTPMQLLKDYAPGFKIIVEPNRSVISESDFKDEV